MKFLILQHNIYFSFFIYSFTVGSFFPRVGDLQLTMNIGESILGLALTGLPLGIQCSLILADKILNIFGIRLVMIIGIPIIGISLIFSALSYHPFLFFLSLIFGGLAIGIIEVAINLEADRVEYRIGQRIMNRSHSFWSLGFACSGLIGASLSQLQISPLFHFILSFVFCSFVTILFFHSYIPCPQRPNTSSSNQIFIIPTKGILALVIFTLSAMLIEGAGIEWSIIFMRDVFSTPAFINGLAFTLGALAQFIVRFFADKFIEKYGSIKVSQISIILMSTGILFVCFSTIPYLTLLGFTLMGGGTAVIFPLAMSAAAQRTDRPAAVNIASLAQISFLVFLIGPPLLGFIAENYGIRLSFGVSLPLLILSWMFIYTLKVKK